jgi:protein TonB
MNQDKETVNVTTEAANFSGCLVEGSARDRRRGRQIKWRAMAISIALESAALSALVIVPMLAQPAKIRVSGAVPIPPYHGARAPHSSAKPVPALLRRPCVFCPAGPIAPISSSVDRLKMPAVDPPPDGLPSPPGVPEGLPMVDKRNQPKPPVEPPPDRRRISEPHISPALLTHRVDPVFPALASQTRKSGKVELHAVIATDGTIESLEVVSGDPMFLASAIDAVRQWRYQPTRLNGQAVEVDTFITVIYTFHSQ